MSCSRVITNGVGFQPRNVCALEISIGPQSTDGQNLEADSLDLKFTELTPAKFP